MMSQVMMDSHFPETMLGRYSMNAGDGPLSYVRNSSYQRGVIELAKPIIEEEIATKLDIKTSNGIICIADFGCSTGHNSFPAMRIITQAIKQKHHEFSENLQFLVFFNDVVSNDYNTLFSSLPPHAGNFYAAGVAGDFHYRLMPEDSLHFAYSSWSLQWLTKVPSNGSPSWNKGQIFYTQDRQEICDVYLEQFGKDIESFLKSRAMEIVSGGLMALLIPGVPAFWDTQSEYTIPSYINLMGSCLMDMVKKGRFSEAKVDSFNLPFYFPTPQQLKAILEKSYSYNIERLEVLNNPGKYTLPNAAARATFFRAVHEGLLTDHFGSGIIDELFDLYAKKLEANSPVFLNPNNDKSIVILVVLKRS